MNQYQSLTSEVQVPTEWPVQAVRSEIERLVQNAIDCHLKGQRVIVTVANVSALVMVNESRTGYVLRRIEQGTSDEAFKFDLILPSNILMLRPNLANPEHADREPINLQFHSLDSEWLQRMPNRQQLTIGMPNLNRILQSKGVTGGEMYSCVFKSTYRVNENIELSTALHEFTAESDPVVFGKIFDQWDMTCFDQLPRPQ